MNRIFQTAVFAIIIFLIPYCNIAQWVKCTNPLPKSEGGITAIASKSKDIFVGTSGARKYGSIFISTNNGDTWAQKNNGIDNETLINSIGVNGNYLFAGPRFLGVFRSSDNGGNWHPMNKGLGDTSNLVVFTFLFVEEKIFIGTYDRGIYMSTDNGESWSPKNNGLTSLDVFTIELFGNILFAGTYPGGIFASTDMGENWSEKNNGFTFKQARVIKSNGSSIFVGTNGGGIFRSTDYGENWTSQNKGLTCKYNYSIEGFGNYIIAGGCDVWFENNGGIFISSDNGENWTSKNDGLTKKSINEFIIFGDLIIAYEPDYKDIYITKLSDLGLTSVDNQTEILYKGYFYAGSPRPTPASSLVKVKIYWDNNFDIDNAPKDIYDVFGNKLEEKQNLSVINKQDNSAEILWNCSGISAGVYFILINHNGTMRPIPILVGR